MLSLWLGGGVCVAFVALGWWIRLRYQKRQDVWADLVSLLVYIDEQIKYGLVPLPTICASYATLYPRSALALACRQYPTLGEVSCLPKKQWEEVAQTLLSLGRSDIAGQAGRLAYAKVEAERMRQSAAADCKKGDLYAKLCVVAGLGLMIWMV